MPRSPYIQDPSGQYQETAEENRNRENQENAVGENLKVVEVLGVVEVPGVVEMLGIGVMLEILTVDAAGDSEEKKKLISKLQSANY